MVVNHPIYAGDVDATNCTARHGQPLIRLEIVAVPPGVVIAYYSEGIWV